MPRIGKYWLSLDLYYTPRHTWARLESDDAVRVGVDDLGQRLAGRILAVRLKPKGQTVEQSKSYGTIETVVETNETLRNTPQLVNEDPYGKGWMVILKPLKLQEELGKLIHGDTAVEWLKKEVVEKAKEAVS